MQQAFAAFAAIHASDPRVIAGDPGGRRHSQRYHQALVDWVRQLSEAPSDALLLAAACQHLRRWAVPRTDYPTGRAGYQRWRSDLRERHAAEGAQILAELGFDAATIAQVETLVRKQNLATDPEMQLFEDAICLAFLQCELAEFAVDQPAAKLTRILNKTLLKMTPRGQALAHELLERQTG